MGAVELLSREGEIAIAKRIEAGREKMIGAICESPMTIRSIINWKDAIKDGTMLLRDIVDLEATYDMSDISDSKLEDTLKLIESGGDDNNQDKKNKDKDKYFHLFGGGITCWVIWQTTTFLGIVLGAFIPEKLGLSFAVPLTFLALLVNDFRKLINVIVIIISGLVATFGFNYVPYKAYVIVAGVTALLTAAILTKLNKKNE